MENTCNKCGQDYDDEYAECPECRDEKECHCDYCDTDYHPIEDMQYIDINGKQFFVCSICFATLSFKMG